MINIDVHKRFPTMAMHFSMEISSNRAILFGPSGSGKSTLLKLITGFCLPDTGRITIGNTTLVDTQQGITLPVHLRQIGYLPQDYTLFPHLTIRENILYGLKARKIAYTENTFMAMVTKLGLEKKLSSRPSEISGGQQQRVALARIMLIQPRLLLLDEPFSALDNRIRNTLRELVLELCKETGTPALLVTHDLEEALIFGREIFIVQNGMVLEHGRTEDIFESPRYIETAQLLNFQIWPLLKRTDSHLFTTSGEKFSFDKDTLQDGTFICIRPENIMLLREDRPVSEKLRENIIAGTIASLHHRAHYIRITFLSNNGVQYILHTPKHLISVMNIYPGKHCRISLKKESLILCRSCL